MRERISKHGHLLLLIAVFFTAFATRYITKHEFLFDPDSYWWYQLAIYFAGINDGRLQYFHHTSSGTVYELAYYPTGRLIDKELLLLPWAIGKSYDLLMALGMPATDQGMLSWMFIFGPLMGALTAVVAYFLGRELTGSRRAGMVAAIFYSFSHLAMTRNTAGDTGQESLGTLLLFLFLLLFLRSVRASSTPRRAALAACSGVLFLLAANTWGGTSFYWGMLIVSVFTYLAYCILSGRDPGEYSGLCLTYTVFITTGALLPALTDVGRTYVIGPLSPGNVFLSLSTLLLAGCVALLALSSRGTEPGKIRAGFAAACAGALVLLLLLGGATFFERFWSFASRLLFSPEEKGLTGKTVAYYRPTGFEEFKQALGLLLFVIPAGAVAALRELRHRRSFNLIFMLVFLLLAVVAYRWMIRLSFFFAFILPLFLGWMYALYLRKQLPKEKKEPAAKLGTITAFVVVVFLLAPHMSNSLQSLEAQKYADQGVVPWKLAGDWIRENTPEDALLVHWWDYGYYMQTFAIRRTIVDGGNVGPRVPGGSEHRNIDVAKAFISPEDEFYRYIAPYNPNNLSVYVLVSVEEVPKSGAITFHAGVTKQIVELWRKYGLVSEEEYRRIMEEREYERPIASIFHRTDRGISVFPEFANATMVKMLFFPEELERFELVHTVWVNMEGSRVPYVRIYRYRG